MHYRKIYQQYYGEIPKGYHIHHIDGNRSNNCIENLKCVTSKEHYDIHYSQGDYGACWAMSITGHISLTVEERSELSRKQVQYQWDNHREKMLAGRRNRDDSCLIGRTWKLDTETAKKVSLSLTPFTSDTANICKNTIWINDGNKNKRINKNKLIPEGFTKGRKFVPWNKKKEN